MHVAYSLASVCCRSGEVFKISTAFFSDMSLLFHLRPILREQDI